MTQNLRPIIEKRVTDNQDSGFNTSLAISLPFPAYPSFPTFPQGLPQLPQPPGCYRIPFSSEAARGSRVACNSPQHTSTLEGR